MGQINLSIYLMLEEVFSDRYFRSTLWWYQHQACKVSLGIEASTRSDRLPRTASSTTARGSAKNNLKRTLHVRSILCCAIPIYLINLPGQLKYNSLKNCIIPLYFNCNQKLILKEANLRSVCGRSD
jgi:hypothetical protein